MSLLAVLDNTFLDSGIEAVEVEYRLHSWGEIYPPFAEDREHSLAAQYILNDYPFKLFSISIPYSELPQKLCLTFRAPQQTHTTGTATISGFHENDVAKEFAAFLTLVTRRRVFAVGQTRSNGIPVEESARIYQSAQSQERQQLKEIKPPGVYGLLRTLQGIDRRVAERFVLAARLYHSAVEMMYSEPEFSYLFLVMSVEAISSIVYEGRALGDGGEGCTEIEQFLDAKYPGWRQYSDVSTPEKRQRVVQMLLKEEYFSGRRFRDFLSTFAPKAFWEETEDDAKPDYVYGVVWIGPDGRPVKEFKHSDKTIHGWERIDRGQLKPTLNRIYTARSKFVHEGVRLPASIVVGHFARVPPEAFSEVLDLKEAEHSSAQASLSIPPLLTFERLVSYCMVEFLRRQGA